MTRGRRRTTTATSVWRLLWRVSLASQRPRGSRGRGRPPASSSMVVQRSGVEPRPPPRDTVQAPAAVRRFAARRMDFREIQMELSCLVRPFVETGGGRRQPPPPHETDPAHDFCRAPDPMWLLAQPPQVLGQVPPPWNIFSGASQIGPVRWATSRQWPANHGEPLGRLRGARRGGGGVPRGTSAPRPSRDGPRAARRRAAVTRGRSGGGGGPPVPPK